MNKDVWDRLIQFSLDHETISNEQEQLEWIAREPTNAAPFYNLAQLRRMQYKPEEGLALLLHAASLDASYAPAHIALAELYAVKGDYRSAWKHALLGEQYGDPQAVRMLERHAIARPS
ncbi:MAG: hypothetical protein U0R19_25405 [Bryobacteraceae bacterium]